MSTILREAHPKDAPAIIGVLAAAFGRDPNSWQVESFAATLTGPDRSWRVAEIQGQVVGTLCVKRLQLRVGQGEIIQGDIGQVSVLPTWQGQGIGSALMHDTVSWMRRHHYDFARLGGLVHFYRRFGFVPFPRRYVEFPLAATILAGASVEPPPVLFRLVDDRVGAVANSAEWQSCHQLRAEFNRRWIGAAVEASIQNDMLSPSSLDLILRNEGKILAYLRAVEHAIDRTEFESRLTITTVAYQPGDEDALVALIIHVLQLAYSRGHQRVAARLPFHPSLFRALTAAQIPYKAVELHEAVASNMVQIVNLRGMFEHLQPELSRRWCRSRPQHSRALTIECAGERVTLQLDNERVEVVDALEDAPALTLSPDVLLAIILGQHAPTYFLDSPQVLDLDNVQAQMQFLLNILFPEQQAAS